LIVLKGALYATQYASNQKQDSIIWGDAELRHAQTILMNLRRINRFIENLMNIWIRTINPAAPAKIPDTGNYGAASFTIQSAAIEKSTGCFMVYPVTTLNLLMMG
jgi:hypothetical protein